MSSTCTTCGIAFSVSEEDRALLSKLAPSIDGVTYPLPDPVDCPHCRQKRRMSFRNERNLHRRKCSVTGRNIISVHTEYSPYKVCDKDVWYSDTFDPLKYGQEYDFEKPFFEQFHELMLSIPLPSLRVERSENCDFNNDMRDCKNCYLSARTHESEDMLYTYRGNKSRNCVDCMQVTRSSLLYECVECVQCNESQYLFFCSDCSNSSFLLDCRNCMYCFMCTNLRNKKFCFLNKQLTQEEYEKKLSEFNFGSWNHIQRAYEMYEDIKKKAIRRDLMLVNADDCSGDNIVDSNRCHLCFGTQFSLDGRYLWDVKEYKDSMDSYSGGRKSELIYFTTAGAASYAVQFCVRTSECHDVMYSFFLNASHNCFGCIGLKREDHCILNKKYSEEDWKALMPKIIEHMQSTGEWGHFFPPKVSPFPYNQTVAHEYFPLREDEAEKEGYTWLKDNPKDYQTSTASLPDSIDEVEESIVDDILSCEKCQKNYKIVPQELSFYQEHRITLPRLCPDCRHMRRFHTKNPPTIRKDTCKKCGKEVETTFPEDTPMQIYCEDCYLKEVY